MNKKSKIQKALHFLKHNPLEIVAYGFMKTATFLPDELYLKILFRLKMGERLDMNNPTTFNQKLQWLKVHDRNPKYPKMVDKYEAKFIAEKVVGSNYIIPTLGVWEDFDDMEISSLPKSFVLKTTHGGGNRTVFVCEDKDKFDFSKAKAVLNSSLKKNEIFVNFREWPYLGIRPRIIAEELLKDKSGDLKDYKFYCFNGEPKSVLVVSDRQSINGPYYDYFDMDFNPFPYRTKGAIKNPTTPKKPTAFEEMKNIAKKLSEGTYHVRVDLYCCNENVYFGEWTFYDASGYDKFIPNEWDGIIGSWLQLPKTGTL